MRQNRWGKWNTILWAAQTQPLCRFAETVENREEEKMFLCTGRVISKQIKNVIDLESSEIELKIKEI